MPLKEIGCSKLYSVFYVRMFINLSLLLPSCVDYLVNVMLRGSEDLSQLENQNIFYAIFQYSVATNRF
jgi:hypothetical protein